MSSLPNEILYTIIHHVDPGDLESFSASCPLFESMVKNALEKHRTLESLYTEVFIEGCYRVADHEILDMNRVSGQHPFSLLTEICEDPQVAWYPRSLKVECLGHNETEHSDEEELDDDEYSDEILDDDAEVDEWGSDAVVVRKSMEDYSKPIEGLVFDSGYFNKKRRERWFNHIRRGNRGATLGLLLTLLPNLETLYFENYTWEARQFKNVVKRITEPRGRNDSGSQKKGTKILTKLREVELCGTNPSSCEEGSDICEDFDLAGYFAKLPSMKKVSAYPAEIHSVMKNSPWLEVGSRTSNIDEISLESETLNATYISDCLGSLKNLRKFHYDDSSMWYIDDALDRSGIEMVFEALLEHAKTSLEYLDLARYWQPAEGSDSTPNPITLKPFEKLKQVSLSCHLYAPVCKFNKEETRVPVHDRTKSHDTGSDDPGPHDPSPLVVPKLLDILPSSIETIDFFGDVAIKHVEAMCQGLVKHRMDLLPHLQEVTFHNCMLRITVAEIAMGKALQEEFRGVGVRLVLE